LEMYDSIASEISEKISIVSKQRMNPLPILRR
jgi:hypothetical protein